MCLQTHIHKLLQQCCMWGWQVAIKMLHNMAVVFQLIPAQQIKTNLTKYNS